MMSLPRALALSFSQLGDPAIVKVLVKSLLVTLAIFALLGALLLTGLYQALLAYDIGWSAQIGAIGAVLLTLIAGWLLFRIVALFVLQFFAEDVVRAVEAKHYPEAASVARSLGMREELSNGLRSTLRALIVNLVALPFAIFLLFTGIGTALLFWAVNAFLLGRELQDMVWLRHCHAAGDCAPVSRMQRFLLGGVIAAMLAVPFANFLAPVLGAASATHLVQQAFHPVFRNLCLRHEVGWIIHPWCF